MGIKSSKEKERKAIIDNLKKTTYFSEKELKGWYNGFINDCPTGRHDKDSFNKIYQQFFPLGDPQKFSSFVFTVFDQNDDGYVDFDEFIKALSITSRGSLEEKLQWIFRVYDLDNDGNITKDEMLSVIRSIYILMELLLLALTMISTVQETMTEVESTPEESVEKIFLRMDKNSDGVITLEEFIQGCKSDPSIVQGMSLYDGVA